MKSLTPNRLIALLSAILMVMVICTLVVIYPGQRPPVQDILKRGVSYRVQVVDSIYVTVARGDSGYLWFYRHNDPTDPHKVTSKEKLYGHK